MIRKLRSFLKASKGSAAVEFAIVSPIFIFLTLSMLELGWMMVKISMVDHAVSNTAKFVYIGAASSGNPSQDALKTLICEKARIVRDCENNTAVELTVIDSFTSPPESAAPCLDSTSIEPAPKVSYNPGTGSEIVFMRVCVTTDLFTPGYGLGLRLVKTVTGRAQIVSSIAFMNEPF